MPEAISLRKGAKARYNGSEVTIRNAVSASDVLVRLANGEIETVPVNDLEPFRSTTEEGVATSKPLDALSEEDFDIAQKRKAAIAPLLRMPGNRRAELKRIAAELSVHPATIYRWLRTFEDRGVTSALAPNYPPTRKKRLHPEVEKIIEYVRDEIYLTSRKVTAKYAIDEVRRRCHAANLPRPGSNTIRRRFKEVSQKETTKKREGGKAARDRHKPAVERYGDAKSPLSVVQIDHTKLDIEIVDDDHRLAIGRPYLTLAIDVFSRMVVGYYLSLDEPSAFSVGMCVHQSILPKDALLTRFNIDRRWPVWGIPQKLHADNGKDFRSKTVEKACAEYNISLEFRPVRTPNWGGHIERLLGTVAKRQIHNLPGTTKSNIREKGAYDSARHAALTLRELEEILVAWIVGVYHADIHSELGKPPLARWEDGILGRDGCRAAGLPDRIDDSDKLRIDFLPCDERTVQRDGIAWDNVRYFSDGLRDWIGNKLGSRAPKLTVRRDPRDISTIYVWDPRQQVHIPAYYWHSDRPTISVWELRAARRKLQEEGK